MIVRSLSRKTATFRELLEYISAPRERGPSANPASLNPSDHAEPCLLWLQNFSPKTLETYDPKSIEREFLENARLLKKRKNGNIVFHEILSFSSADRDMVTEEIAEAVARHYLELRAPHALAVARVHFNTSCPHVHLMISANNLGDRRRLRLPKRTFGALKPALDRFVQLTFPELPSSGCMAKRDRGEKQVLRETRPEQERRRRGEKKASRKQQVFELVQDALIEAKSPEDLLRRLLQSGLRLYRRGRSIGVEDTSRPNGRGKKYRLSTLGLEEVFERAREGWRRGHGRSRDYRSI